MSTSTTWPIRSRGSSGVTLREREIGFVSLTEGFNTTTPTGRLLLHILAALAEMARELIRERTVAGLARCEG